MSIDIDKIVAIDVHTHAEIGRAGEDGLPPEWRSAAAAYFGEERTPTRLSASRGTASDAGSADTSEAG